LNRANEPENTGKQRFSPNSGDLVEAICRPIP
jgi:hypothetical protein